MPNLNLDSQLSTAVEISQSLAKEYSCEYFYPAHLLRALMHPDVGLRRLLDATGTDTTYLMEWAEVRMEECPKSNKIKDIVTGSNGIKILFEEADKIRINLGLDQITPFCVLAAVSRPGAAFSYEELKSFPLNEKTILSLFAKSDNIRQAISGADTGATTVAPAATGGSLFKYCIERTRLARDGKTGPIIGRDNEMRQILEILCRRTKPNVIITGEPGVGKSALIDGLAYNIVQNRVPKNMEQALVFELDMGELLAGASYKGEIEDRLKKILREIKRHEKAILFIDEIHMLFDARGSNAGAANLLKPELARGEITVIGATTNDEYRKLIEPDQAIARRFELLNIAESGIDSTTKILFDLRQKFEAHHQLVIHPDAIRECVKLSKRYIKESRLPDSAIDVLDRTMAAIKLMTDTNQADIDELKAEADRLRNDEALPEYERFTEYKWLNGLLQTRISPILLGKLEDSSQTDRFEIAAEFETYLDGALSKLAELSADKKTDVTRDDIALVVSYKTGIPLGKIQAQEKEKLLNMEEHLKLRIIGQDHAVKQLADCILESRSGLNKAGQPIGSFFFMGPTGTGKTELTKSLADFLFNDEKAMTRFDMSEFKEAHSAALLYGAPPGYVGYEEGGMLVNKIRQKPYSVLLFDEIEKAHPSVFDTFLQILDEGHMHDRLGKEGDFSNALIIFTSNIGSEWIAEQFEKGEIPSANKLMEIMTQYFRPEFLARITEIVPFAPISIKNLVKIFDIQLKGLIDLLTKQGIAFAISDQAKEALAYNGFTPKYGARQISTVIRNKLRRPISKYIISGELKKGQTITIDIKNEELTWDIK